jgi:hypothetical protein
MTLFWLLSMSGIRFRDDFLLTDPALTSLPRSPIDFFIPNSGFHKAWSLSASVIWLMWRLGLSSLFFYKCLCITLHVFNFLVLRVLSNKSKLPLAYFALVHPALYLTLSWSYQFTSLLSLSLTLLGWLAFEKSVWSRKVVGQILSTFVASLFAKPWAVILVLVPALISPRRLKPLKAFLFTLILVGFVGRSVFFNFAGLDAYVDEVKAMREFESGSKQINRVPFTPQLPPLDLSLAERGIIRSVYMANTAVTYASMLIGVSSFSACHSRPALADIYFVIGILIIFAFLTFSFLLLGEKTFLKNRKRLSDDEWLLFAKGLVWLFAAWLPVSGLFYIPQLKISFMSPHYVLAFLPGFIFLLEGVAEYFRRREIFSRKSIQIVIAIFLIGLAVRHLNLYWRLNQTSDADELARCMIVRGTML